ncbi:hypothetical protein HIO71_12190 [Chryseobacterium aquaticum]|uniref:Uncharacterized protein n=1 Tax=Chryseobacterium aquaticum TaxID=452084 RepID=A0A848N3K6_9FLAO|nr:MULTISPECIES: hypothetical protein [Chryseobacterium]NMR34946.1 hypothetical protein [Chryseobacterium aquaticum]NRQ47190.1 hypothetical protein [Chryseobacterium sp. C-204]
MIDNIADGWKLFLKAIDKSSKKKKDGSDEEEHDPNYNLGWFGISLAPTLFVLGRQLVKDEYNWYKIILYPLLTLCICFIIFMIFFTYKAKKNKREKKENQEKQIEELKQNVGKLEEKVKLQNDIISKLEPEKGYGIALKKLHIAFSIVNQYFYEKRNNKEKTKNEIEDEIKDVIKSFCNCLSDIYTEKVGAKCSVSIKLIEEDFEKSRLESIVKNFERDKNSTERDNDLNYKDHDHKISDNTCFYKIVKAYIKSDEENLHYSNNHLSTDTSYDTSSLECLIEKMNRLEKKKVKRGLINPTERPDVWRKYICYQSEIVVPLLLVHKPFENSLLGFLCVDSEIENAFNEEYDVPLIKGVADGIYEILTDFKSLN